MPPVIIYFLCGIGGYILGQRSALFAAKSLGTPSVNGLVGIHSHRHDGHGIWPTLVYGPLPSEFPNSDSCGYCAANIVHGVCDIPLNHPLTNCVVSGPHGGGHGGGHPHLGGYHRPHGGGFHAYNDTFLNVYEDQSLVNDPLCATYGYHSGQQPVIIGNVRHHPACPSLGQSHLPTTGLGFPWQK